jgi:HK97 family phage major capsid protein
MNVEQLKREKSGLVTEMKSIQAVVEARADKTMTAEERTKFSELRAKAEGVGESIANAEFLAKQEADAALRSDPVQTEDRAKSFGDLICRFIKNPQEFRTTTLGNAESAGLIVPPEIDVNIRAVDPSEAIVRPRATVLSGGSVDTIKVPAFDQNSTSGVYGGLTMSWAGEVADRTNAGDVKLTELEFTPFDLVGYIDFSKTLLENSAVIGTFAEAQMRKAIIGAEEKAFLTGSGVGQPLGLTNPTATVTVTRSAAGEINYEDILNMVAASLGEDNVFVISKANFAKILSLKDEAGNAIWHPAIADGAPSTLLGYDVLWSERLPSTGSGDIVFADLAKYYIRDGVGGTRLFTDPYTRAIANTTRIYVGTRVDGKPAAVPIKGEDGVVRSAFVVLS